MITFGSFMATPTSSSEITSTPQDSPTPGSSDHFSQPITNHKLNGLNYLQWSQSVMLFICGRGKDDHLTGAAIRPDPATPEFRVWKSENSMVMSWLISSMTTDIGENFLLYSSAKDIWDAARETYSSSENTSELFESESILHDLRQGEGSVTNYFNALTRYWQRLDLFEVYVWKCPADEANFKSIIEKKRVFKFLLGLNKNLDEVRGRVLGAKPLPGLREAFSAVRREESRQKVMLLPHSHPSPSEGSALHTADSSSMSHDTAAAARGRQHGNPGGNPDNRQRRPRPFCDHCKRLGHTKETCWVLHGKPADWKPSRTIAARESQAHVLSTDRAAPSNPTSELFNRDQLDFLHKLIGHASTSPSSAPLPSSGSVAQRGSHFFALHSQQNLSNVWIVDSGASDHMSGNRRLFRDYTPCQTAHTVRIADGSCSKVVATGTVQLSDAISLRSTLFVPTLDCNLLSVSKLAKDLNCVAKFSAFSCVFQDLDSGKTIGSADCYAGLYLLKAVIPPSPPNPVNSSLSSLSFSNSVLSSNSNKDSMIMLWHYRLGHPNFLYLKRLFPSLFVNKNVHLFHCDVCQMSKHTRTVFRPVPYKQTQPFSLIHSDIWGPCRTPNITGARWFLLFVDDHTRLSWVFLMRDKSETTQLFKQFHFMIQNQFSTTIKVLKTDNANDYFNSSLGDFLTSHGIVHQSSCVDTPQQNGVAERKNRHLLEVARSLLFQTHVPKHFWGEAIPTVAYLINRMPSRTLNFSTPCQSLLAFFPTTRLLTDLHPKVFGCSVFIHIHSHHRGKLDPRSLRGIFVGYSPHQKGYKCYSPTTPKFYTSMDVTFLETTPFYPRSSVQGEIMIELQTDSNNTSLTQSHIEETNISDAITHIYTTPIRPLSPAQSQLPPTTNPTLKVYTRRARREEPTQPKLSPPVQSLPPETCPNVETRGNDDNTRIQSIVENVDDRPIALRKGVRSCTQHPISNFVSLTKLSPSHSAFISKVDQIRIPSSIFEALQYDDWKAAAFEEIKALEKNHTWDIIDLPPGKKTVGCKWLFSVKHNADGSVERLKARLVAKGYTQSYGIDYHETFAPVAKLNTIRVLLSLAANLDWPLFQLDVKNAFLNGDLDEEVYMDIPQGFDDKSTKGKVCKLRKSLYGLKQSPRAWFDRFANVLKTDSYSQCQTDHTMFVKHQSEGKITVLIVYVDDIVLTGSSEEEMVRLKKLLSREFEIKDLGFMKYFLGMEVARSSQGISVSQRKYVLDLLRETGMLGSKPADTPMDPNIKLGTNSSSPPVDKGEYQRLVRRLIYLSHTRPDIAFAVSVVSQFMNSPTVTHMEGVYRVLRYLKKTPGKGLMFRKNGERNVIIYTDADYAGSATDRRSTSGYCSMVFGNLVTWRSKKQAVVSRSSAEAEYRSLSHGICEGIWIQRLLKELKIEMEDPIQMMCDNQAAISIAKNPVHHDRTKHVEVDRHFISEKIDNRVISLSHIPSQLQLADILTKALHRPHFDNLCSKLGMLDIYSPSLRGSVG